MNRRTININQLLAELEFDFTIEEFFSGITNVVGAKTRMIEFHDLMKKQRKILAKKYHPDVSNSVNSEEKLKQVNSLIDMALKFRIQPVNPRPQLIVRFASAPSYYNTTTASTGSSYSCQYTSAGAW